MHLPESSSLTRSPLADVTALAEQLISLLKLNVPYSEVELDALYNVGVQFFQTGKFDDASRVFGTVNMLAPFDPVYLQAQAKCLKSLGAYEDAHEIFRLAWTLDQQLPESALHGAECLMLAGRKDEARELIAKVLETPAMINQNPYLRDKAEAWRALLTSGETSE